MGDARRPMEKQEPPNYDVPGHRRVFRSSDAIPVHLLTREGPAPTSKRFKPEITWGGAYLESLSGAGAVSFEGPEFRRKKHRRCSADPSDNTFGELDKQPGSDYVSNNNGCQSPVCRGRQQYPATAQLRPRLDPTIPQYLIPSDPEEPHYQPAAGVKPARARWRATRMTSFMPASRPETDRRNGGCLHWICRGTHNLIERQPG